MDYSSRVILRAVLKLLIEVMNSRQLTEEEHSRVHAAYRRLLIAMNVENKSRKE